MAVVDENADGGGVTLAVSSGQGRRFIYSFITFLFSVFLLIKIKQKKNHCRVSIDDGTI